MSLLGLARLVNEMLTIESIHPLRRTAAERQAARMLRGQVAMACAEILAKYRVKDEPKPLLDEPKESADE